MPMLRKIALVLAVSALATGLAGCKTVKGLGQDIESVGSAGSRAVNN
jgi:entericidin B